MREDAEAGLAEVWVPDRGSTGELVRHAPWVRTLRVPETGFAAAVNAVARETRAPWIATANVDFVVEPGALQALLDAGARDPRSAVLAPRVLLPDGTTLRSARPFPGLPTAVRQAAHVHALLARPAARREAIPTYWNPDRPRRVPWAYASFLMLRREALVAVGGLDGRWREHGVELDLSWRLRRAGWATCYEPRATVRQQEGAVPHEAFDEPNSELSADIEWTWLRRRRGPVVAGAVAAIATGHSAARLAVLSTLALQDAPRWAPRAAQARADLRVKLAPAPQR